MNKNELILKIQEFLNLNSEKYSDGEIINMISDLIKKEKE